MFDHYTPLPHGVVKTPTTVSRFGVKMGRSLLLLLMPRLDVGNTHRDHVFPFRRTLPGSSARRTLRTFAFTIASGEPACHNVTRGHGRMRWDSSLFEQQVLNRALE